MYTYVQNPLNTGAHLPVAVAVDPGVEGGRREHGQRQAEQPQGRPQVVAAHYVDHDHHLSERPETLWREKDNNLLLSTTRELN